MTLKDKIDRFLPYIEDALKTVIDQTVDRQPELRSMLAHHMGWEGEGAGPEARGKRIRPLLVLLCAEAAGGEWENALPAAAAVELLHNFSLIHDDIQDKSLLRRGRPTVWSKWGVAQAINAGDVMFTQAFIAVQRMAETVSPVSAWEANKLLQETCLRLTEGQYLDISFETRRLVSMNEYWPMITGKTSVLLGCCAELGALSAGAAEWRRKEFYSFGIQLGLAFQALDDWLGIWGDVSATGKSAESDLASGKKTLPVVYALESNVDFQQRWHGRGLSVEEIPQIVKLLGEAGADTFTLNKAGELSNHAKQALTAALTDPSLGMDLLELTDYLLSRKK
jgi:geranylgeranyl diphosphate synthase type I